MTYHLIRSPPNPQPISAKRTIGFSPPWICAVHASGPRNDGKCEAQSTHSGLVGTSVCEEEAKWQKVRVWLGASIHVKIIAPHKP